MSRAPIRTTKPKPKPVAPKPKPRPRPAGPRFEKIPAGEAKQIAEIAQLTAVLQDRRKAAQKGELLRGVHPKSHGCVNATFTIKDPLRAGMRVGLFSEPGKSYKAKIRYSNATTSITPDLDSASGAVVNTSRGFALKVMGVKGRTLLKDGRRNSQDFLMINTPGFAFANVRDYLRATHALMADPDGINGELFFLPLKLLQLGLMDPATAKLVPPKANEPAELQQLRAVFANSIFSGFTAKDLQATLKSFAVVQQIQAAAVRNPLECPYFTAAPFKFGNNEVARFAVFPTTDPAKSGPISAAEAKKLGPDFLAKALAKSLADAKKKKQKITLSFRAQVVEPVEYMRQVDEMIEDATATWDEDEFPFVELATIEIDPAAQPKDLVDACKKERFTPWHSLAVHQPLGGINRLRKPVYVTSGDTRTGKKVKQPEKPGRGRTAPIPAASRSRINPAWVKKHRKINLRDKKLAKFAPKLQAIRGKK